MAPQRRTEVFLQPGEYAVGKAGCRISTVLGSCVSITLWHPQQRVGAMSHFLLPRREPEGALAPDGRYGEEAMWLMLRALARLEVDVAGCQAKIFGGGNMFPAHAAPAPIGHKNGEAARALVRACGIGIVAEHLFGSGHRQIRFDVATGNVWARQLRLQPGWTG